MTNLTNFEVPRLMNTTRVARVFLWCTGALVILCSVVQARDWYVRPAGGNYGTENGTSYDNAWDGLENIVWGTGGIEAGDTLTVSGTHIYTNTNRLQAIFTAEATGTRDNPILIKGNPSDPAIIWGAYIDERPGGMRKENWTEVHPGVFYNESSMYHQAFTWYGLYENIKDLAYDKYTVLASSQEVIDSAGIGVYYIEEFGTTQHKIWLRPFKEATFKDNIYWSGHLGYLFNLNTDARYIEYRDITYIAGGIGNTSTDGTSARVEQYTLTNCRFLSHGARYIYALRDSNDITFDGCEFAYGGNGIYVMWRYDVHHLYVQNCYFHDIGIPFLNDPESPSTDAHAIGIQNNKYFYLIGNRIERCGSGIVFHVGEVNTQRHCYVIGNYITEMRLSLAGAAPGSGILFSGDSDCPKGNTEDYLIAYNIVTKCEGHGIAGGTKGMLEIYNNIVYSCNGNYTIYASHADGSNARFYNNISLYPREDINRYIGATYGKNHIFLNENYPDIVYDFEADNNIYYPVGPDQGCFGFIGPSGTKIGATFEEWKEMNKRSGDTVDAHSFIAQPLMSNESGSYAGPLDFMPQNGSIAIDAGFVTGLTEDFDGDPVPLAAAPDIGAFEYDPGTPAEHLGIDPNATSLNVYNNIIIRGNPSALIVCNLAEAGSLSLIVYDSKGEEILALCNDHRDAGLHTFTWSGLDASGSSVGSGIYMVHIKSGGYTETKKIAVIK